MIQTQSQGSENMLPHFQMEIYVRARRLFSTLEGAGAGEAERAESNCRLHDAEDECGCAQITHSTGPDLLLLKQRA